ncbi:MAG: hypothetical protein ACRYHQ_29650 [Janthinobacterium lividum]
MAAMIGQAASEQEVSLPPAADDAFAALVHDAQASLTESIEKAGLGRDPYRFPMGALAQALGVLPAFMSNLDAAVDYARQPVNPAVLERNMEQAVQRLAQAASRGADRHTVQMVKARNLRTMLTYGGTFIIAVLAAAGGGFFWGQASANAAVHETEERLAQAFQAGPGAAANWANLMRWNDINAALATCTADAVRTVNGRRACFPPLWIDPPQQAVRALVR